MVFAEYDRLITLSRFFLRRGSATNYRRIHCRRSPANWNSELELTVTVSGLAAAGHRCRVRRPVSPTSTRFIPLVAVRCPTRPTL